MANVRLKLGEADAAKYKEGDAWFVYDQDRIRDMPASEVIELESHLGGYTLAQLEQSFWAAGGGGALGMKGMAYIARRLAGVTESWDNFDPQIYQIALDRVEAPDVGPTGTAASGTS